VKKFMRKIRCLFGRHDYVTLEGFRVEYTDGGLPFPYNTADITFHVCKHCGKNYTK